jgi:MoCo/4Fe-4S cofactor protein with predicted Tat translocation signal
MSSVERTDRYWRSLGERADTPEFREMLAREYPNEPWEALPPATRRSFLKVMGASLALAGLAGCRYPKEEIVPFARPAGYTPGVALQYATAMELGGVASGLLVTSYDGRPTKVEGNPGHPVNQGAADAITQASILGLYDPSRSRSPARRQDGQRSTVEWDGFADYVRDQFGSLKGRGGQGLHILSEASSSVTLEAQRKRLQSVYPLAAWHEYEPLSWDNERKGTMIAFGEPMRPQYSLDKADVVVCLDADPLSDHPAAVKHARDFADGRRRADSGAMNRLYAVESVFSVTGTMADHRFPVQSRQVETVAGQLAAAVAPSSAGAFERYASSSFRPRFVEGIAKDLLAHHGRCVVIAGPRQPAEVHAMAHAMNVALGAVGTTVTYTADPEPQRPSHVDAIASAADAMRSGSVDTLLILGGNPVYDAPADVDFAGALAKVPNSIHLSLYEDETSRACQWHLPRAHYLESWGDARAYDGTVSVVQPLIEPLYGGKTPVEVLSFVLDDSPAKGYDLVRAALAPLAAGADFERFWTRALNDGIVPNTAWPLATPAQRHFALLADQNRAAQSDGLEVVFVRDVKVHDGRFANNGWLQEMPDPLTKMTWDNAAIVAPATAKTLGVKADDLIKLRANGREIEAAVYVLPGQAADSITIALGYGRKAAGKVADGAGFDAYMLRTAGAMGFAGGASVQKTGGTYALSCTQDHHAIDLIGLRGTEKRLGELVREADFAEYKDDPAAVKEKFHEPELHQMYGSHPYTEGYQWGMSIDLNACTGCGACAVACTAENNVPVVGKEQVGRSREMHWLRIDRYFKGTPEAPQVAQQPVACVQCENAPCEQVCPVGATVHSAEGLNQMTYNRCVGTRYCANNCPYKVRRFNWFNFHKQMTETEKMAQNPEVTVRARGVMEKCTYCVQRIEAVKIVAKNAGREIRDGEVVPACAQTCPSRAIVFGNLNDPESRVRKLHESLRSYGLLEEINTRPRTRYLAKIRNTVEA